MFSERHLTAMCFDAAISTDDVGIGSPAASTVLLAIPDAAKSLVTGGIRGSSLEIGMKSSHAQWNLAHAGE